MAAPKIFGVSRRTAHYRNQLRASQHEVSSVVIAEGKLEENVVFTENLREDAVTNSKLTDKSILKFSSASDNTVKDVRGNPVVLKGVSKTRVLWSQQSYSAVGAAPLAEASLAGTSYGAVGIFPLKKYADDVKIRVTCQLKTDSVSDAAYVAMSFTNGAGSYIAEVSTLSMSYTELVVEIDVTTGNPSGEELTFASILIKNDGPGKITYIREAVVEMISTVGY